MSFSVEPEALRDMAHTMRDVAFDVVYPWQYADQHLDLSGDGVLFGLALDLNKEVLAKLDDTFSKLMDVSRSCEARLDEVAHHYQKTDHAVEARMDRRMKDVDLATTYPAGPYPDAPGSPVDTVPEED